MVKSRLTNGDRKANLSAVFLFFFGGYEMFWIWLYLSLTIVFYEIGDLDNRTTLKRGAVAFFAPGMIVLGIIPTILLAIILLRTPDYPDHEKQEKPRAES